MIDRSFLRFALGSALLAVSIGIAPFGGAGAAPGGRAPRTAAEKAMDRIAESYVRLALAVGEHDPIYVDAYYGPAQWQAQVKAAKKSLAVIKAEAEPLVAEIRTLDVSRDDEMIRLRREYLIKQLGSLAARVRMLEGAKYAFDEESAALYDAVAPRRDEDRFRAALARIDSLVPRGEGSLVDRLERFRKDFLVPKEKLDTVFAAAIAEARARTRAHMNLPPDESFTVEYVTNQPWGAYNWYKGDNRSVIQVNMDIPIYIGSMIGWACHEGYPGHHVKNVLYEQGFAKERGWVEFTVVPLFAPQALIDEGTANFGVEVAFPGAEALAFERDVLYPLAGLDPGKASAYYEVRKLQKDLNSAENDVARLYLDGEITADEAARRLSTYTLVSLERARKLVSFIDRYRSYIINYSVGYDLVKDYVEKRGGSADEPQKRWEEFGKLLSAPRIPSGLK
jgi:hypothetical protein